jgi:bifunctional UDP-N-acetylglucosamine pyrophosphorylase/glucosamine-1-phosphate N-acetyltransferase
MNYVFDKTGVIILAAGRGFRLGCEDIPKVLCRLNGKPMLSYILNTLEEAGVSRGGICIVLGYQGEKIKQEMGEGYHYAWQEELLGTAHAASTGENELPADYKDILVLNGDDSSFYTFKTLSIFVNQHIENKNDISLLTCEVDDPTGMGRVVRDLHNNVVKIVEKENVGEKEKDIKEISTGTFCFNRSWFKKHYRELKKIPGLNEYGLPSFIDKALASNAKFRAIKLSDPSEWLGINTAEQLQEADKKMKSLQKEQDSW